MSTPTGVVWNSSPPPVRYNPLPAQASSGVSGGCGFDWSQVRYEEFSSSDPLVGLKEGVSIMPAVLSRPPKPGFFWLVFNAGWSFAGANVRSFAMFIVPPDVATPEKLNGKFRYKDSISGVFRSIPMVGIRLHGSFNAGGGTFQSSNFMHASDVQAGMLVVPPGWALLVAQDDNNDAPGSPAPLLMQVAYAELPIGSDSPGFGG